MANLFATPSWTLKETGRKFEDSVRFVNHIERKYSSEFEQSGAKVGNTINYRVPQQFNVSDGAALDLQNIADTTVPISLTNQKHVDMSWSAWQETTEVDDARNRYINKAAQHLAAAIDALAFSSVYRDVPNAIGTPGTTPSTNLAYLQAGRTLDDLGAPSDSRCAVLDSEAMIVLVNANLSSFNPSGTISEGFRKGMFGRNVLNIDDWYTTANRPLFTTGAATSASSPRVNGANQSGTSLITSGWGSGATNLKKGDRIKIAGVYSVNPLSKVSTGRLREFVLTADVSDSTGAATLSLYPPIVASGAYQNVSNVPGDTSVITLWSMADGGTQSATASPTGMIFHKEAFAGVTADLALPSGGAKARRISSPARGFALRMAETWDVQTDQNITRIDTIVGFATTRPDFAVRVQG